MPDANKLHLKVTAGSAYETSSQTLVPVNTTKPVEVHSDNIDAQVKVKIKNYRGNDSPKTDDYFEKPPHASDLFSISFNFKLKESILASELLFGNDFDQPIRDSLPPGFNAALRIVKWSIDPSLDGDVYADKPFLFGPLASSINTLWVGDKVKDFEADHNTVLEEGGSEEGKKLREEHKIPSAGPARQKHFLTEAHRKDWTFEAGREYRCDFFNPYLDFNDLALSLPGNFKLHLLNFWDGQPLRFTLKHKASDGDKVLLVLYLTLIPEEDLEKEKQGVEHKTTDGSKAGAGRDQSGVAGGAAGGGDQEEPAAPAFEDSID